MSDLFFICVSVQEDCVCETIDDPARGSQFKKRRTVVDINLDEFSKRSSCVHTLMILFFLLFLYRTSCLYLLLYDDENFSLSILLLSCTSYTET